jgi:hypothetical protein
MNGKTYGASGRIRGERKPPDRHHSLQHLVMSPNNWMIEGMANAAAAGLIAILQHDRIIMLVKSPGRNPSAAAPNSNQAPPTAIINS